MIVQFQGFKPTTQLRSNLPADTYPFHDNRECVDSHGWRYRLRGTIGRWRLEVTPTGGGQAKEYPLEGARWARIEYNHCPRRPQHPPAILYGDSLAGEHAGKEYTAPSKLLLLMPTRTASGVSLGEPVEIDTDVFPGVPHSGGGSTVISSADLVFVAYHSSKPEGPHVGTDQYLAVVKRTSATIESREFLGRSDSEKGPDEHDIPAITMDSEGVLHVLLGSHHGSLFYLRSQQSYHTSGPGDVTFTQPESIGKINSKNEPSEPDARRGHTYVGLVCDSQDRLHTVTRYSGEWYRFTLSYKRREATGEWTEQRVLVHPGRSMYVVWYHQLSLGDEDEIVLASPGVLWTQLCRRMNEDGSVKIDELAQYEEAWPGEIGDDEVPYNQPVAGKPAAGGKHRHSPFTLVSADGGEKWFMFGEAIRGLRRAAGNWSDAELWDGSQVPGAYNVALLGEFACLRYDAGAPARVEAIAGNLRELHLERDLIVHGNMDFREGTLFDHGYNLTVRGTLSNLDNTNRGHHLLARETEGGRLDLGGLDLGRASTMRFYPGDVIRGRVRIKQWSGGLMQPVIQQDEAKPHTGLTIDASGADFELGEGAVLGLRWNSAVAAAGVRNWILRVRGDLTNELRSHAAAGRLVALETPGDAPFDPNANIVYDSTDKFTYCTF